MNPLVRGRRDLDWYGAEGYRGDFGEGQWLAGQLHHPHLIRDGFWKQQERLRSPRFGALPRQRPKKSQADKPTWPFWLKLSAGGQLDGYLEYVELVVVAAVSFF